MEGDPAKTGAEFREFLMTSDDWNSMAAVFQVYGLEGVGRGIKDGGIVVNYEETKLLSDGDFNGSEAADKKFKALVDEATKLGFKELSLIERTEVNQKLHESKGE